LSGLKFNPRIMRAKVSIIMGSTSDLPVMEKAAKFLDEMEIPFELNALSAHRTPEQVEVFAKGAYDRGIRVIIAGAGMAAHLPGVIAAMTPMPVIGVPIKATLDGMDSLLAIVQMPPGIPVATVGINGALNAGILAAQILSVNDEALYAKTISYKENLKQKIVKANEDLAKIDYKFKV
jgi:5-(carboxyamino)imidazole ribonucleotide mutase